ncbi:MAG: polysaccharide biosynthesis tyrosine autokinase [Clostridia bacterium]|nr:polysaccharide biosynthesis tyrosine autokinase [Clostridia bacterium]
MDPITNKKNENSGEVEIDLLELAIALLRKAWLIALVTVVCAIGAFVGTKLFVQPTYRASAVFYVSSGNSLSIGSTSLSLSDINLSTKLVTDYMILLNTRETMDAIADYAGVGYSNAQLKNMISASAISNSEFFRVYVTAPVPEDTTSIANAIAQILPKRINEIMDGSTAKLVEKAVTPTSRYSPNYTRNTLTGALIGFLLTCIVIVLLELLDNKINEEADISAVSDSPILAAIPEITLDGPKKGYDSGYKANAYSQSAYNTGKQGGGGLIGSELNFAASEAYKLLRTKVLYSFADEKKCHVIGVTSSRMSEGKSLTSINLAYSLALSNKRVLLIDGDMRLPTLAKKLKVTVKAGLSDLLTNSCNTPNIIRTIMCSPGSADSPYYAFLSSGKSPPNPGELLGSERMRLLLNAFTNQFDYVIIDLPPISEVSDALDLSKYTDGMLVVVRRGNCTKQDLASAISQLQAVDAHLIGFIFNYSDSDKGKYYKKGYYHKSYYQRSYQEAQNVQNAQNAAVGTPDAIVDNPAEASLPNDRQQ